MKTKNQEYRPAGTAVAKGVSTVSFRDAMERAGIRGEALGTVGDGLDKHHAAIAEVRDMTAENFVDTDMNGPVFGHIRMKAGSEYYGGVVYGYRSASDGLIMYSYSGGMYTVCAIGYGVILPE